MKQGFLRVVALLLAMMVCMPIVACGDGGTAHVETAEATSEAEPEETTSKWLDSLPDVDMEGAEFNILTAAEQWQYFYNAEETGDIVNDAVYERNRTVEERFNCKINYQVYNGYLAGIPDVKKAITGSVMGGTMDFDLMVGSVGNVFPLIAENLFTDMKSCDQLSFDSPWWLNKINDQFMISGRLFLGASAFGTANTAWSVVTYFNKNVAENFEISGIYDTVLQKKWTFDKMNELAVKVTHDANGDNVIDENDVVGIVSTDDYIKWLSTSMGYDFFVNDGERIILNGVTDKLMTINHDVLSLFKGDQYFSTETDLTYSQLCNMVANNKCLFAIHRLELAGGEILREFGDFGVIPMPMFDEEQEEYITPIIADVCGIPLVVRDTAASAALLEALSSESYRTVLPVYFEKALKLKYMSDDESSKMLDMIIAGSFCDLGYAFTRNIPGWSYDNIDEEDIASYFAKKESSLQKKVNDFVDKALK